jgi:3-oxoacyl-[acyl-carrier protein] reductase
VLSNALRAAVTAWSKTLSREEAAAGVTVNCVEPGLVATDRLAAFYTQTDDPHATRQRDAAAIPAGRFGDPSELAAVITFLGTTQAACINGVTLLVDGGLARGLLS